MGDFVNTIVVRVYAADLSTEMSKMRDWLNKHGCEPTRFDCRQCGTSFELNLDFSKDEEGRAFRNHFCGREVVSQSPLLGNVIADAMEAPQPETMTRARWWRLMAEEIRTDADQFASDSAKDTMAQVASTYDRMAENLERRLANHGAR